MWNEIGNLKTTGLKIQTNQHFIFRLNFRISLFRDYLFSKKMIDFRNIRFYDKNRTYDANGYDWVVEETTVKSLKVEHQNT